MSLGLLFSFDRLSLDIVDGVCLQRGVAIRGVGWFLLFIFDVYGGFCTLPLQSIG